MIFKTPSYFIAAAGLVLLSACASFQLREDIQSGRQALLLERPRQALGHFQRAADMDRHYVTDFTVFEEGIWTYVGRAHYGLGDLEKARKALERASRTHGDDHLAHVYLGLVLMRQGDREKGLREAKVGLRSLRDWLRRLDRYDPVGVYWDPGLALERRIENLLAMMNGEGARSQEVISGLEWLGREVEEEIDRAREDEQLDLESDNGDSPP